MKRTIMLVFSLAAAVAATEHTIAAASFDMVHAMEHTEETTLPLTF